MDITMLFRHHYAELVRLAVMLVGDRPTAEDVVQDVFARLHARRDRPGPTGGQLAYVRACVLNGCRSALRHRTLLSRLARTHAPIPDLPHESAPLAAAASVVLIVAVVSAADLFAGPGRHGQAMGPPRYYATVEQGGIVIRATATGAVTARLARPLSAPGHFGMYANVAAGDGDREFVAEYTGTPPHGTVGRPGCTRST